MMQLAADRIDGPCHAGPPIRVAAKRSQPLEDWRLVSEHAPNGVCED